MNKLIMCEGETDAILLSYYLENVAEWKYCKAPKNLDIKKQNSNESVNWYRKGEDYLLICGVGGKDNFGQFFRSRIKKPLVAANAFDKIAIVTDRDNDTSKEIETRLGVEFEGFAEQLQDRVWCENLYQDLYGIENKLEILLIEIPTEQ